MSEDRYFLGWPIPTFRGWLIILGTLYFLHTFGLWIQDHLWGIDG